MIAPWAEREGYGLLKPEEDVGTSGSKVPPLQRPKFLRACDRAKAAGAECIIAELPDRFSRQDPELAIWEKVEVRRRYGLEVLFACFPLAFQVTPMGRSMIVLQHAAANMWVLDHTAKVVSGMARGRARGVRYGRKPKVLREHEIVRVLGLRAEGLGWERIAVVLNKERGLLEMTDKRAARERGVSSGSLRRMDREGTFAEETGKQGQPDETTTSPKLVAAVPDDAPTGAHEVLSSRETGGSS